MLIFNNGLESLNEALFVLGTFLNIEENETITGYKKIEIVRDKQNEV